MDACSHIVICGADRHVRSLCIFFLDPLRVSSLSCQRLANVFASIPLSRLVVYDLGDDRMQVQPPCELISSNARNVDARDFANVKCIHDLSM